MADIQNYSFSLWKWVVGVIVGWTLVGAFFAWYSFGLVEDSVRAQAHGKAMEAFNKDHSFRLWGTMHGGVYVPITEETQPNPYLKNVPDKNITTHSGKRLTLMNPAYMVRQLNESFAPLNGVKGHITSLDPIRPANAPDPWERRALEKFEQGVEEVYEIVTKNGEKHARLMRPVITVEGCMKCHAHQGYEVGNVRGGISVTVPMNPLFPPARAQMTQAMFIFSLVWSSGVGLILLGAALLKNNLSEREALAERLRTARRNADAANLAKSIFLANMSHEIRTPLNGITGMLRLIRSTSLDKEQTEYANAAITSGKRLTSLLSDILDYSMADTGKLQARNEPVDLAAICDELEDLFEEETQKKGVRFTCSLPSDVPQNILGDPVRLSQILTNLVGNAVKFTSEGTVTLEAHLLPRKTDDKCNVLFTISDTGCGIPDDKLTTIMEPFGQVAEGYTRGFQGAGLGLPICKKLVDILGGTIEIESRLGEGTQIRCSIPFSCTSDQTVTVDPELEKGTEPSFGLAVLLAEDDRVNQLLAQKLLTKMGCSVRAVENGREAVAALRTEAFDAVIMDIQMPEMDGIEATKAIRRGEAGDDRKDIPIIAMTAYAMSGDKEAFLDVGMDDYVSKPIDVENLRNALKKLAKAP